MNTRVLDADEVMQVGDLAIRSQEYVIDYCEDDYDHDDAIMVIDGLAGDTVANLMFETTWWVAVLRLL